MVKKTVKAKSVRRVGARVRRGYRRVKSSSDKMGLGKLKLGEAALFALVGYEGAKILDSTPIPQVMYDKIPAWANWVNQRPAGHGYGGENVNKTLGALAILKVAYDAVKTHKVDSEDMNVLLPFALGTVFEAPTNPYTNLGGVW